MADRPDTTTFTNRILERNARGEKALGIIMGEASEDILELCGRLGLDFVLFDGQHYPLPPERIGTMCRIADAYGITPTMRVLDAECSTLLSYLDRGIRLIMLPNLETVEQAEALVAHTYLPPLGRRSVCSNHLLMKQDARGPGSLFTSMNDQIMLVAQIESPTAVDNLDDMLKVDGIDTFHAGEFDMALTMGIPGGHDDPRVTEIYERVSRKVRDAGKQMYKDRVEAIRVFDVMRDGAIDLLERHGRRAPIDY
ncbi:MAG: hypothetical protein CMJ18_14880 [Phycisphaeraceae bacterium]|nr:hypothetical protein [Phycisphaeraceae bacterium]